MANFMKKVPKAPRPLKPAKAISEVDSIKNESAEGKKVKEINNQKLKKFIKPYFNGLGHLWNNFHAFRVGKTAVSFTKNKFCFILNAINNSEDLLWQKKMFNM